MWTTLSFRGERTRTVLVLFGLLVTACSPSSSQSGNVAPDTPRPARDVTVASSRVAPGQQSAPAPVEISSVRLRLARRDTLLTRLMGHSERLLGAREPVAIEVITAQPLGNLNRTASPEIYLDGVRIGDTWALLPNRLIAFVPERANVRAGSSVTVAWLGNEERTRTLHPVVLTEDHLRELR